MINTSVITVALVSHLLAVVSPGPDFVVALKNSIQYSRTTGIYTALGFALGIGVHLLYGIFGLSFVIQQSPRLFAIIKYAGAVYLIYLAISLLRNIDQFSFQSPIHTATDISPVNAVTSGFLTNVLNPKASLFFLSLLTFVLKSNPNTLTLSVICFFMMFNTFLWFSCVALFFNMKSVRHFYEQYQNVIVKGLGIVLFVVAIIIIFN